MLQYLTCHNKSRLKQTVNAQKSKQIVFASSRYTVGQSYTASDLVDNYFVVTDEIWLLLTCGVASYSTRLTLNKPLLSQLPVLCSVNMFWLMNVVTLR